MRLLLKQIAVCVSVVTLFGVTQSVADGGYEAFGPIEKLDSPAREIWIHGRQFRLAPNLVVYGLAPDESLRAGMEVGYVESQSRGDKVGVITSIWVDDE